MPQSIFNIFVWLDPAVSYEREMMKGVARYALQRPNWRLHRSCASEAAPDFSRTIWHGVIGFIRPTAMPTIGGFDCPMVDMSNNQELPAASVVTADGAQAGRTAARFLIDRGSRRFAFVGRAGRAFSTERHAGFAAELQAAGHDAPLFVSAADVDKGCVVDRLRAVDWPAAVLAANDSLALEVARQCRAAGVLIPDELALLGIDNDDLMCCFMQPPLSSVNLRWEEVGTRAAAALEDRIGGGGARQVLVAPAGVVPRGSAERSSATADPYVTLAIAFIHAHADRPMSVDEAASAAGCSRRRLENGFRASLGRTPHDEIQIAHFDLAKRLLAGTDFAVKDITFRAGFTDVRRFITAFGKHEGITPRQYRLRLRS